jgi:hypothetical protein
MNNLDNIKPWFEQIVIDLWITENNIVSNLTYEKNIGKLRNDLLEEIIFAFKIWELVDIEIIEQKIERFFNSNYYKIPNFTLTYELWKLLQIYQEKTVDRLINSINSLLKMRDFSYLPAVNNWTLIAYIKNNKIAFKFEYNKKSYITIEEHLAKYISNEIIDNFNNANNISNVDDYIEVNWWEKFLSGIKEKFFSFLDLILSNEDWNILLAIAELTLKYSQEAFMDLYNFVNKYKEKFLFDKDLFLLYELLDSIDDLENNLDLLKFLNEKKIETIKENLSNLLNISNFMKDNNL